MIDFLKKNRLIILVFISFLGVYGIGALFTITKEATPTVNVPYYNITTLYPGADPKTIDEQVTDKLDKKFKTISLVKKITSSSSYNVSSITIEFYTNKKDVDAVNDIKAAIDQTVSSLPSDVKTPVTRKVDITGLPIYQFALAGPYSSDILYQKAKILEDDIKSIPGVSDVNVSGNPTKEITLNFHLDTIQTMDLDLATIVNQLRGSFLKMPVDKKNVDGNLYSFEINTYPSSLTGLVDMIQNLDLINAGGKTVKVKDIADVYLGSKESSKKSFLLSGTDSINAISFSVSRTPGFDIQNVTLALKQKVEAFKKENTDITTVETQSSEEIITKTYNMFLENFWETGVFVFIVVVVFLGWRSSFIVLISFLIVYLINSVVLKAMGYTFNNIVSFSLILVLGIMVDNLIVMTQGIALGLREHKGDVRKAIQFALANYGSAVFFGTLCTIVIFIPLLFGLTGIVGEYMKSFPVVIDTNLTISLVISLIGLPVLFTYLYKHNNAPQTEGDVVSPPEAYTVGLPPEKEFDVPQSLHMLERWGEFFGNWFYRANRSKARSWLVIITFWLIFIGSFFLIGLGFVKVDFLGDADQNNVWINMKHKAGITIQENQITTKHIVDDITAFTNTHYSGMIDYISVDVGSQNGVQGGGADTSNYSSITFKLHTMKNKGILDLLGINKLIGAFSSEKKPERTVKSYTMVEQIRAYIDSEVKPHYPEVEEIAPVQLKGGPSGGKPIGFYLVGDNLNTIGEYMAEIMPEIKKIEGVFNVTTNVAYTNGRFVYMLDQNKIKETNTSALSVATILMGMKNSNYQPNGIGIKEFGEFGKDAIKLQGYVNYTGDISQIKIGQIPLQQLIKKIELQPELKSIDRSDNQKAIHIEADKTRDTALGDVTAKLNTIIKNHPLPDGVSYKQAGDVESQDSSGKDLGVSVMIGMVLMYLVLVVLFRNFKYPTAIISSIFLSVGGAIIIIAITGLTFNFPAELAIFGVLGVGVNQAIIHIEDFKIFYEKQGMSTLDSFRKSIAIRFVPIFLTKLTTILGLIILSFKDEIYGGLAVAFIGGLLMSFFITLMYLPALITLTSRPYKKKKEQMLEDMIS